MWVIAVYNDLQQYRDYQLNSLLNLNEDLRLQFLSKNGSKYHRTNSIITRLYFKRESNALKVINSFNQFKQTETFKTAWSSKYAWIKDYYLATYPVTKEEWNKYIDDEISIEKNSSYNRIAKLDVKRNSYK